MGIALLSFAEFLTPLQLLANRFMPIRQRRPASISPSSSLRYVSVRPSCAARPSSKAKRGSTLPLRVVQMVDARQPKGRSGRMLISGRIADVCAELDRLVALEESRHTH